MNWWFLRSHFRNFVNGVRWHRHHFDVAAAADNNKVHKTQNTASLCCVPIYARRTQSVLLTLYSSSTHRAGFYWLLALFSIFICVFFFVCGKCELQSGLATGGKWMYWTKKNVSCSLLFFALIQAVLCSDVAIFVLSFFVVTIQFHDAATGDCRLMGF